ncbi:nuclear transport factor 2 family protein [Defluviimonas aestuarii]|uniref:nuclear transport factor 2 family protein n=1 Tax=Albidovulum aestuarii TaxID=1130726 RepID=UPI00249C19D2|nr:nuclear transport factor 2 family protein [Defluviimonas aestuarii]MDI3335830.1 nuclear transport factor 2 family protein [Defluviimonas aestuarii]
MDGDFAAVEAVLRDYFDGLYHSDAGLLARVFHPKAIYVSATEGPLIYRTMAEYFPIVEAREAPAARNEARADRIVGIAFAGPVTATAQVNCAIGPRYFTDCLTLILDEGRWQIISKVFHWEERTN